MGGIKFLFSIFASPEKITKRLLSRPTCSVGLCPNFVIQRTQVRALSEIHPLFSTPNKSRPKRRDPPNVADLLQIERRGITSPAGLITLGDQIAQSNTNLSDQLIVASDPHSDFPFLWNTSGCSNHIQHAVLSVWIPYASTGYILQFFSSDLPSSWQQMSPHHIFRGQLNSGDSSHTTFGMHHGPTPFIAWSLQLTADSVSRNLCRCPSKRVFCPKGFESRNVMRFYFETVFLKCRERKVWGDIGSFGRV